MYNGIGLQSARGSATSGHVTKNLSHVKPNFYRDKLVQNRNGYTQGLTADSDDIKRIHSDQILDHKKKREIENRIFEYEDSLREDGGFKEDEIIDKVLSFRNSLSRNPKTSELLSNTKSKRGFSNVDSHEMSYKKNIEIRKMKEAFGIKDKVEIDQSDQTSKKKSRYDGTDNK